MGGVVQENRLMVMFDEQRSEEEFVDQSIFEEKLSANHNLFARLKEDSGSTNM
jgi:hypothetical protein